MKIVEIIESKHWVNVKTNNTASIYGSVPYNDSNKQDWTIVSRGFTVLLDNGTIGVGRQPFKTLAEAEQFKQQFNSRY